MAQLVTLLYTKIIGIYFCKKLKTEFLRNFFYLCVSETLKTDELLIFVHAARFGAWVGFGLKKHLMAILSTQVIRLHIPPLTSIRELIHASGEIEKSEEENNEITIEYAGIFNFADSFPDELSVQQCAVCIPAIL